MRKGVFALLVTYLFVDIVNKVGLMTGFLFGLATGIGGTLLLWR